MLTLVYQIEELYRGETATILEVKKRGRDKSEFREFFEQLQEAEKKKLLMQIKKYADHGIVNKLVIRKIKDDIYEFKSGHNRVLCGLCSKQSRRTLVLLNCFKKQEKKTPENEKKKACEMFNDVKEVMEMERL